MESVHVERLDHIGLIDNMIKDVGLISMTDARLVPDAQEEITPGEAVAGMILHGLGFAKKPLTLTPQFFANKPLDLLFREGVHAEMFNRFKLGRTLDEVHAYGCDLLFSELALMVCAQERIEHRFAHLDTTSFSLTGDYVPESDEQAIRITHGYAKDHRPDLKQAVVELLVSQDGGVPLVSKSWDGNTSDTQIFKERAEALMKAIASSPTPRYLVADAKLYTEDTATTLAKLGFITRIPGTIKLVSQVITQALQWDRWHRLDETTRYDSLELCHYGIAQRWLVVSSQAAMARAEASITKAQQREWDAIEKHLFHLHAQRFETPEVAQAAIPACHVSDAEVIRAYKAQSGVEGGFRFLKDPVFFVSSLFVKKPSRIQGVLMVMTLALLVYALTQRRLRQQLAAHNETIPNQIHQPTERPTLRWVFQLLEGIHRVRVMVQGQVHDVIEGLNDVQIKILRLFGDEVCRLYQISPG